MRVGIGVSLRSARYVKLMAIRPRIASLMESVADPPETVVPAVSDSSVLDEGADEPVEDVEDEAPVAENVAVGGEIADVVEEVEVADKEEGEVVDEDVEVGTPAGAPVLCPSGRVSGSVPSVPVVEAVLYSLCSFFFRLLLHVEFSPLSFVGSFLNRIVLCYAPGVRPLFCHIRTVSCVGSPLLTIRIGSA